MAPSGDGSDSAGDLRLVHDSEDGEDIFAGAAEAAPNEDRGPARDPLQAPAPPAASPTSSISWLLMGAMLLFAWLWLTQVQKANDLAAQLAGVESDLVAAKSDIAAWEVHSTRIQSQVGGIVSELGSLQELLADAPTTGASPAAAEVGSESGPISAE
ncbi:MAG: hypothetical protein VX246_02140 [Myxococcota bacterium]|nr:hypothetical protein [Myxococcota bacterium]